MTDPQARIADLHRKGQRPPAVRQIGKGTGDGFGMLSWRKQHAGEVVACVDCGADTPRLSYRTKRCPVCQPVFDARNKRAYCKRRRRLSSTA